MSPRESSTDTSTGRKRIAILQILRQHRKSLTSAQITAEMTASGMQVSERTVRLYLKRFDDEGLTRNHGRRGRTITKRGVSDAHTAQTVGRVGFLSAKIDAMTYAMDFDLATRSGSVIVNTSLVPSGIFADKLSDVMRVFAEGYAMGTLTALTPPGERIGEVLVPEGMLGLTTVCSITLNGVLLKHGIPCSSKFGGLIELRNRRPTRFAELIEYTGTSIDPLVVFIRGALTDYIGAINTGDGLIGASFRVFPATARKLVHDLAEKLKSIGMGGFMTIGLPGKPLFDIPVGEGLCGAVLIGGLNPVAILEESGVRVQSWALATLLEYNTLFPYTELPERLQQMT